jgi:hypothetical protein
MTPFGRAAKHIVYSLRDQDWATTKSLGVLHVATRVLEGLEAQPEIRRIDVLGNRSFPGRPRADAGKGPSIHPHFQGEPAPRGWARLLWDNWTLVRECDRLAPDWLLLPKGFGPLLAWPRARVSAYVHDNVFGHYRRQRQRPFPRGEAALFEWMLRRTARHADVVVTNSESTAAEFRRDFNPRGRVLRIGAPIGGPSPAGGAGDDSLLLPTSAWPHKLTVQAIAWLERWSDETGFKGPVHGYGALPANGRWPDRPGWRHHGWISPADLAARQRRAAVLVYFSAYEGYGLPPVEAAAAGLRVAASDLPPLRETLPAACRFDNGSYESFQRVLTNVRAEAPRPPLRVDTAAEVAERWLSALQPRAATSVGEGKHA